MQTGDSRDAVQDHAFGDVTRGGLDPRASRQEVASHPRFIRVNLGFANRLGKVRNRGLSGRDDGDLELNGLLS